MTIDESTGGVIATDENGEFVFGVAAPWAVDYAGKNLPTWFEIDGGRLTQVVDASAGDNIEYPIVADPWLGVALYSSVTVTWNFTKYTVNATPSTWGKTFVGIATWPSHRDEVKSKAGVTWSSSIQNQLYCHLAGFPLSLPTYNLESWRPNVGWATSLATYKCNP